MSGAFDIGAIGMRAQQRALDAIANNISNVNTPGFKRSELRFSEIVAMRTQPSSATGPAAATAVQMVAAPMLAEQGELEVTGRPLDLAIEGAGFIELLGPGGQTLLWRGGRLRILEDGSLASAAGLPLKAGITMPIDTVAFTVGRDGVVKAITADSTEGVDAGQIALVQVDDIEFARRLDGGLYAPDEAARITEAAPGEDGLGMLVQGAVERSTVSFNDEMVRMLLVQRAYAANAQIVQAADQLLGVANNLRR